MPLKVKNQHIRDDNNPLCPHRPVTNYPAEMEICRPKGSDLGNIGMWNQWEFAKRVLGIARDPEHWTTREMESCHQTLGRLTVFGVLHDHGVANIRPPPEPARAEPANSQEDFSFFDIQSLLPGLATVSKKVASLGQKDQDHHEGDDELSDFSDGVGSDPELDDVDLKKQLLDEFATCRRRCLIFEECCGEFAQAEVSFPNSSTMGATNNLMCRDVI